MEAKAQAVGTKRLTSQDQDLLEPGAVRPESHRQTARVLFILRQELGMELAFLTEFVGDNEIVRHMVGDSQPFGFEEGAEIPLEGSYCQLIVRGELDPFIPDTAKNPLVAALPLTAQANLGAYAGVPVRFDDGRLYGTLCCASGSPVASLAHQDSRMMAVLARVIADALAEDEQRSLLEQALVSRTDDLEESTTKLASSHSEMVRRLSKAVEYRDDTTGSHVRRVGALAQKLALAAGLSAPAARLIGEAAPLHDVGKVAVPDAILNKPGKLTADEREVVETHARIGHELMAGSESAVLRMAARIALTHHERFDGAGYPARLAGEQIPVEGRIVAIVDVFDALSSARPYRPALDSETVRRILEEGRGSHFDPVLLDLFLESLPPH